MTTAEPSPGEVKACCGAAYSGDVAAFLLGESYHPGGLALTRRLADSLGLRAGQRVLDVASGPGATAIMLAREYGVRVDGVDLTEASVGRARRAADEAGVAELVAFSVGDAERLPFDDGSFDAVICECAWCTFPNKRTAATELARVLRPGGRVGVTDVTVNADGLPAELTDLAGWVACLADARSTQQYTDLLSQAGLRVRRTEAHDTALTDMIDRIEARLRLARMLATPDAAFDGADIDRGLALTRQAGQAVTDGVAGYCLLVADRAP